MTSTEIENTANPSSDSPAHEANEDVILRCSDNVDLRFHREVLSDASYIFKDMLRSLPAYSPDSQDVSEVPGGPPILSLPEDGNTLSALLQFHVRGSDPVVTSLTEARSILGAALKYRMYAVVAALKTRLVELGATGSNALSAFAIACSVGLKEEAEALVPFAYKLRGRYVPELHDITAGVYHRLCHYNPKSCDREGTAKEEKREDSVVDPPIVPPPERKSKSPRTPSKDTESPPRDLFDSPTADFILQSTDGVALRVHSTILSLASPVFAQLVADHADIVADQTTYRPLEVPEDARTLATLLEYVYPYPPPPPPPSLDALQTLLEVAHKYQLQPALAALRAALPSFIRTTRRLEHPTAIGAALRVFALAHRFAFAPERATALRALLRVRRDKLCAAYDPALEALPASAYFHLLTLHRRAGEAAFRYLLHHALLQSGSTHSKHCDVPDGVRVAFEAGAQWTLDVAHLAKRDGHGDKCRWAVLEEGDDPAWAHFRKKTMPRWWLRYVYDVAVLLRDRPLETDIVTYVDVLQKTIAGAAACSECREHHLPRFIAYAEVLKLSIQLLHVGLEGWWDDLEKRERYKPWMKRRIMHLEHPS